MKVKFLQHNTFEWYDDLVYACLKRLGSIQLVDNIDEATLVVCNYHGLKKNH